MGSLRHSMTRTPSRSLTAWTACLHSQATPSSQRTVATMMRLVTDAAQPVSLHQLPPLLPMAVMVVGTGATMQRAAPHRSRSRSKSKRGAKCAARRNGEKERPAGTDAACCRSSGARTAGLTAWQKRTRRTSSAGTSNSSSNNSNSSSRNSNNSKHSNRRMPRQCTSSGITSTHGPNSSSSSSSNSPVLPPNSNSQMPCYLSCNSFSSSSSMQAHHQQ